MQLCSIMRPLHFLLAGFVLFPPAALYSGSIESAFQAREVLGPEVWSRVLKIENNQPGRGSHYPAEFHGLVFAFEGMLWLYTALDGTQSLSLYSGRLAADQADLAPLLRAIEPGLNRFTDVTGHPPLRVTGLASPPHDCLIVCLAQWQRLQRETCPPSRARLLAYYVGSLPQGHAVLEFWRGDRHYVFDPAMPATLLELSRQLPDDPIKIARAIFPAREGACPSKAIQMELHPAGSRSRPPQIVRQTVRDSRDGSVL